MEYTLIKNMLICRRIKRRLISDVGQSCCAANEISTVNLNGPARLPIKTVASILIERAAVFIYVRRLDGNKCRNVVDRERERERERDAART